MPGPTEEEEEIVIDNAILVSTLDDKDQEGEETSCA